jgi:hypothetical protein
MEIQQYRKSQLRSVRDEVIGNETPDGATAHALIHRHRHMPKPTSTVKSTTISRILY